MNNAHEIAEGAFFPSEESFFAPKDFDPDAPALYRPPRNFWELHPYRSLAGVASGVGQGTCFSVGPNFLVTAAHVVANSQQVSEAVHVISLSSGEQRTAAGIWIDRNWNGTPGAEGDLALIKCDHDLAPLSVHSPTSFTTWATVPRLFVAGVVPEALGPKVVVSPGSWYDYRQDPQHIYYVATTLPAQSGSPVFAFRRSSTGENLVSAIHAGPGALRNPPGRNFGISLDEKKFHWINRDRHPDESHFKKVA